MLLSCANAAVTPRREFRLGPFFDLRALEIRLKGFAELTILHWESDCRRRRVLPRRDGLTGLNDYELYAK